MEYEVNLVFFFLVNAMASNLTNQVRDIATVTTAVAKGDLTRKVEAPCKGEILELKSTSETKYIPASQMILTLCSQLYGRST